MVSTKDKLRKRRLPKAVENLKDAKQSNAANKIRSSDPIITQKSWCSRCFSVMKYVLLFIVIPPFLNLAALNLENVKLKPEGLLYDVGFGQKLYLNCEGRGLPTVLLDAPTGLSSDVWSLIQHELAKHTKVCVYDRAGLGFSERPYMNSSESPEHDKWQPFTVERMADDVHRLVSYSSQQLDKPFIYVGSELGALVARFYTQLYESDVTELVLIDPLVEGLLQQDGSIWQHFWFDQLIPSAQALQMAAAIGLTRITLMLGLSEPPIYHADLPGNVTNRQKYLMCNPRHLSSVVDEHFFIEDTFSQMQTVFNLKPFPSNISITVITGNYYDEQYPSALNKAWAKSTQHLLSHIHPNSNHIVVNGADHRVLYRQPRSIVEPLIRVIRRSKVKSGLRDR